MSNLGTCEEDRGGEARGIIAKYKKWLEKDLKRKLRVKVGVLKAPPKSEEARSSRG